MTHIVFVHGVANKPEAKELLKIWRRRLSEPNGDDPGIKLGTVGISTSLVYWADIMYEKPDEDIAAHESDNEIDALATDPAIDRQWQMGVDAQSAEWMGRLSGIYGFEAEAPSGDDAPVASGSQAAAVLEAIPLPWFIKRRFMKAFARDTHHYLFDAEHSPRAGETYRVRQEVRKRFVDALEKASADGDQVIVIAHSQGTIVAYDCLKSAENCPQIAALMTVGTPLGLDEVQQKLKPGYNTTDGFPSATVLGDWVNVFDPLDIVSRPDPRIANDYRKAGAEVITDVKQVNSGPWRHSMTKYLGGKLLRNEVRRLCGIG